MNPGYHKLIKKGSIGILSGFLVAAIYDKLLRAEHIVPEPRKSSD